MDRYQVKPRGGTNPIDLMKADGGVALASVLQFRTKRIADLVARELNLAYQAGVRDAASADDKVPEAHPGT